MKNLRIFIKTNSDQYNRFYFKGLNAMIYAENTIFSAPLPIFQLLIISRLWVLGIMETS